MDFIIKSVACKLQGITATKLKNRVISIVINAEYPLGIIKFLHKVIFRTQSVRQRSLKTPIDGRYDCLTIWHTVLQIGNIFQTALLVRYLPKYEIPRDMYRIFFSFRLAAQS